MALGGFWLPLLPPQEVLSRLRGPISTLRIQTQGQRDLVDKDDTIDPASAGHLPGAAPPGRSWLCPDAPGSVLALPYMVACLGSRPVGHVVNGYPPE